MPWFKDGVILAAIALGVLAVALFAAITVWGLSQDQACRDSGGVPTRAGCLRHEDFQPLGVVR